MAISPLLALPAEVFVRINEFVLTHPSTGIVHESSFRPELNPTTFTFLSQALALTRTCKQVHEEGGALLYTLNDFDLNLSAFLANVILVRHLTPRFDISKHSTSSSLNITLPWPLKSFDVTSVPDNVAVNQSRALLYRLSDNLCRFQDQHPKTHVAMKLLVRLNDLTDDSRLNIEVDFKRFEISVDDAVDDLREMLNNNPSSGYFAIYIRELLQWKQQRP